MKANVSFDRTASALTERREGEADREEREGEWAGGLLGF